MGKYFQLQYKRLLRFLPGALLVTLILTAGLLLTFRLFTQQTAGQEENQKFPFAFCGETQHSFLQMGLSMLSTFDSSRYALELLEMEEQQAALALSRGEISAYAVIPEGFMEEALSGRIMPIRFYSTAGATGIVSIVKEELSNVVSTLLISSQEGVYGMWDAMADNGLSHKAGGQMDRLALVYVDYIFARDNIYSLEELGISDTLGLEDYILSGLGVLLLMLICLSFAPRVIPGDPALGRLLCSKGKSSLLQALCDFGAYGLTLFCLLLVITVSADFIIPGMDIFSIFLNLLPVLLLAAAFSFMLYSLSQDVISGIMLMFFLSVILCFVSGCLYPVHFFPVRVQQLARWLPMGVARTQLARCITGSAPQWTLSILLAYCAVFTAIGVWARVRRIREVS